MSSHNTTTNANNNNDNIINNELLTLTGATLLSSSNNNNNNNNEASLGAGAASAASTTATATGGRSSSSGTTGGSAAGVGGAALVEMTTTTPASASGGHKTRTHGHNTCRHHHGHHRKSSVQFQLNIPELLEKKDDSLILQTLFTLVRMGPYDLYLQLLTAWQVQLELKKEESGGGGGLETYLANARDDRGHSLLHWAAKRTDDTRFVRSLMHGPSSFARIAPTTRTELDGMTPIHWACTESHALPVLKLLLSSSSGVNSNSNNNLVLNTSLLEVRDSTGCTPLLIASQHGHVDTVAWLVKHGASQESVDSSRDTAVHWAAYKGSLSVLGLLTRSHHHTTTTTGSSHNNNSAIVTATTAAADASRLLEAQDAYGQTPLHLAALRGHGDVCKYILRQLATSNSSADAGRRQVLYLLNLPDKNQRTPYQLAIHKQKYDVANMLSLYKSQLEQNRNQRIQSSIIRNSKQFFSLQAWKIWMGFDMPLSTSSTADDSSVASTASLAGFGGGGSPNDLLLSTTNTPQFPFYYVAFHIVANYLYYFIVFVPVFKAGSGVLWDCMLTHVVLLALLTCGACNFYWTYKTDPGKIIDSSKDITVWRRLYEQTLEEYANDDPNDEDDEGSSTTKDRYDNLPPLCHTCHVARPPRSKHDKYTESCVLVFDHHCPFVGNTVGLYNYKYFYVFCLSTALYLTGMACLLILYYKRMKAQHGAEKSVATEVTIGIFLSLHGLFGWMMVIYHTYLLRDNLTTNESLNRHKYKYLWRNENAGGSSSGTATARRRAFYNPFNKGWYENFVARVVKPNHDSFMLEEQFVGLLSSAGSSGGPERLMDV